MGIRLLRLIQRQWHSLYGEAWCLVTLYQGTQAIGTPNPMTNHWQSTIIASSVSHTTRNDVGT